MSTPGNPWWRASLAALSTLPGQLFTRRGLLILAGVLVCLYSVFVLVYVQAIPDLGLRTAFSTGLKAPPRGYQPIDGPQPSSKRAFLARRWRGRARPLPA